MAIRLGDTPPEVAVWVKIPDRCRLAGEFDPGGGDDLDIHFMLGSPTDDVNLLFEREALRRFINLAEQLLAIPEDQRAAWPRLESAFAQSC
jgi:hypothetical protein